MCRQPGGSTGAAKARTTAPHRSYANAVTHALMHAGVQARTHERMRARVHSRSSLPSGGSTGAAKARTTAPHRSYANAATHALMNACVHAFTRVPHSSQAGPLAQPKPGLWRVTDCLLTSPSVATAAPLCSRNHSHPRDATAATHAHVPASSKASGRSPRGSPKERQRLREKKTPTQQG